MIHRRYFNEDPQEICQKLPTYYLIPKFHKPGYGCKTRPISSCRNTCLAECAGLAARALNHLREHFINITNLEKNSKGLTGIKSINSTDLLLKELDNIDEIITPHTLNTFDFKSVFTSFDFKSIMDAMKYVITRCFNSRTGDFLVFGYKNCYYSSNNNIKSLKLRKEELLDLINTLLNESYVKVGNWIFRQTKGIPMGSKSSAILCDLSLISVEHQFLIKPIPDTIKTIYTPLTAFRYQDDILVFNYPSLDFMKIYRYIYPNELELEADPNETGKSVNYLDTRICLNDNKIVRSLYDKRDSF
ncbi:hypothetical protein KC717_07115, partial [Candidatus Dojkabacteria bacterium]|nr:hypothetical protein [Candidatus Dojkabacteria bacterium]